MKITDPEVIKNGEKDLIDAVREDLDPDALREILKERLAVADLTSKGGQIVVHENQIAFRLDFEVNLSGSLLFDRDGNFIDSRAETALAETSKDAESQMQPPGEAHGDPDLGSHEMDAADISLDDFSGETDPHPHDNNLEVSGQELDLPELDVDDSLLIDDDDLTLDDDDIELDDDDLTLDDDLAGQGDLDGEPGAQNLDDDINDILKESREFWEQKKE